MRHLNRLFRALGVVGVLLMFLAQTPPDTVRSSLSKWVEEATALVGDPASPEWLANPFADTVATWLGGGLFAVAVIGAMALWFRRHAATAVPLASSPPAEGAGAASARTDQAPAEPVEPDMTMRAALHRLVGVTMPNPRVRDLEEEGIPPSSWKTAALALREAARDGRLQVWGRRLLPLALAHFGEEFSELEEEILADHWRLSRLSVAHCAHPEVASICRSEVEPGAAPVAGIPVYGYLRVNRRQVERLWPQPGTFRRPSA